MSIAEFLEWSEEQAAGRYELFDGDVVSMAPERVAHVRRKLELCIRLKNAVAEAGLQCETFTDGIGVATDERSVLIPDALVRCGEPLDGDLMIVPDPIIIVEVASPSTRAIDTSEKLTRYLRMPTLHHYLIAQPVRPTVIHHARGRDGWLTRLVGPGPLLLDPPGITLHLD